jgi:hypothetical protein
VLISLALVWADSPTAQAGIEGRHLPLLAGAQHDLASLAEACIELPDVRLGSEDSGALAAGCSVSSFEQFASFDGLEYYRAHYCLWPHWQSEQERCHWNRYLAAAQAIFVGRPGDGRASVLFQHVGDLGVEYFQEPQIVENRFGHWLHINLRVDGTGYINASSYLHWSGSDWRRIDAESWLDALITYLETPPEGVEPGLALRKGVWPELASMQASIPLYRAGDCNACASGGWLEVSLGFESGALVIESISHRPPDDE